MRKDSERLEKEMKAKAKELNFEEAMALRNIMIKMEEFNKWQVYPLSIFIRSIPAA